MIGLAYQEILAQSSFLISFFFIKPLERFLLSAYMLNEVNINLTLRWKDINSCIWFTVRYERGAGVSFSRYQTTGHLTFSKKKSTSLR